MTARRSAAFFGAKIIAAVFGADAIVDAVTLADTSDALNLTDAVSGVDIPDIATLDLPIPDVIPDIPDLDAALADVGDGTTDGPTSDGNDSIRNYHTGGWFDDTPTDDTTLASLGYPLHAGENAEFGGGYGGAPTDGYGNGPQDAQGNNPYRDIQGNKPTDIWGRPSPHG